MVNITEYFKTQERVFIRNRTKPLGVISIPLITERGETSFALPKTTMPIELTAYVPKEQIVKSAGFRTMVMKGIVELLTEDEYNRIVGNESSVVAEKVSAMVSGGVKVKDMENEEGIGATVENKVVVNPRVLQLVNMLNIDEESELGGLKPSVGSVIEEFENMDLTSDDLAYIVANTEGKVKEWCLDKLVEMEKSRKDKESVEESVKEEDNVKIERRKKKKGMF